MRRRHLDRWTFTPQHLFRRGRRFQIASTRYLRDSRFYPCDRDIRTIKIKRRWRR